MKKIALVIIFVLLVSLFVTPGTMAASQAEIQNLVTFETYDARQYDFNGIRAKYTLDTDVLENLETNYNVTIGVLLSADVAEDAYETKMVIGNAKVDTVFYSTSEGYKGKYYTNTDDKKDFVYAVTFETAADKKEENLSKAVALRVYVKLVSKSSGAKELYYINSTSDRFGYTVSMKEIAENFVATTDKNYPILQRLLNSSLKEVFINNISIDKYSITGDSPYTANLSNVIKEKFGYKLPVVSTPYFADSYIGININSSLAQNVLYQIAADKGVISIGFKDASYADSALGKFEDLVGDDQTEIPEKVEELIAPEYKVTYGDGADEFVTAKKGQSFTLPIATKDGYKFLGYYTEADVQVTDATGKSLAGYTLSADVTVSPKFNRLPSDADTESGQLLGNPLKAYYSSTGFAAKMARNPQDLVVYGGKVYIGGGYYGGGWISAPPMSVYDTQSGQWGNVDFAVKMYEAFDPDNTTMAWYTLPSTKSDSNNVSNRNVGVIPVTTDCEISNFRLINGKPIALGADTINGNTWANGVVSTATPTDGQKSVANNLGNYYIVEEDENGNEKWVEYRNNILHGTHVYDVVEIDYNGGKTLMFAVGTGGTHMPVKILTDKATRTYISPKFYLKDGSSYDGLSNNRVYNFFKTDNGIFAFYAHHGGTAKKIFKYNFTNNEHRFDEVRDIIINASTNDTKNYQQTDINSSGTTISTRQLWTDFMRTETYNGYAYYTTGYLFKTKTFEMSETAAIAAPSSAIITDLIVRDGKLYALGFVKTDSTTNAYTNYIWSVDTSDNFTQIRTFKTTGAYALSFDKDNEFFYVGLGGPTTHITTSVTNVGNILKLSINPITE